METPYLDELDNRRSAVTFKNRRLEVEYRAHVSRRSEPNVRRQLLLGASTFLGFSILDLAFVAADFAREAAALRAGVMLPAIIAAYALTFVRSALWVRQLGGVLVALTGALTALVIGNIEGQFVDSAVPGSYFIIIVFSFFFLGLRYAIATATTFALVGGYVMTGFLAGGLSAPLAYNGYSLLVFTALCALGAGQLELARRRDFLKERVLSYRADRDALSGLTNRRAFDAQLRTLWESAKEQRTPLALMLIDIDHFKAYNDRYGHQAGDRAIERVGRVLKRILQRPQDFVSRYGGEEFAVILPNVDKESALNLAESLRVHVLQENLENEGSEIERRISVSIGVAHLYPHSSEHSPNGFLQMSDEALYSAKRLGRNRVVDASVGVPTTTTGVFRVPGVAALGESQ
jgi:diguanylate cyclase (GGDEF)-like protein